jgi:hypothetical protein
VVVIGQLTGSADFGGGVLTSAGASDVFVVAFAGSGAHLWSKRFGDASEQDAAEVAVDANGNVLVAGAFMGSLAFGGPALVSAGGYDAFLAKLDSAGNHVWSRQAGGLDAQYGHTVAVDPSANVAFGGYFFQSIDLGGAPLTTQSGDGFLALYGP